MTGYDQLGEHGAHGACRGRVAAQLLGSRVARHPRVRPDTHTVIDVVKKKITYMYMYIYPSQKSHHPPHPTHMPTPTYIHN